MTTDLAGRKRIKISSAFRDFLINSLPIGRLPSWLRQRIYGCNPTFVFLTHPRHLADIYQTMPILKVLSKFVPKKALLGILSFCPCFVVARVKTKQGLEGLIISTSLLPDELFGRRNRTLKNAEQILKFIRKITEYRIYIGLAAWWPIVTNGGLALKRFLSPDDRLIVTNGHCATLVSIVMSVKKICAISHLPLKDLKILVIGIGKMGGSVARAFNGYVNTIGLVDQNPIRLETLETILRRDSLVSSIETLVVSETNFPEKVLPALTCYHIAICTTSNIGYVINDKKSLRDCIILDDARPEAFPRIVSKESNAVVLEGGLIKIDGLVVDSDFGFGNRDNIFGCLAEALLLNIDSLRTLHPTLGEVDFDNFRRMLDECIKYGITEGEFKSGHQIVGNELLKEIIQRKIQIFAGSL